MTSRLHDSLWFRSCVSSTLVLTLHPARYFRGKGGVCFHSAPHLPISPICQAHQLPSSRDHSCPVDCSVLRPAGLTAFHISPPASSLIVSTSDGIITTFHCHYLSCLKSNPLLPIPSLPCKVWRNRKQRPWSTSLTSPGWLTDSKYLDLFTLGLQPQRHC